MTLSVSQLYEVMAQLPDPVFILSEDGYYVEYIGGVEQQSYQDGNPQQNAYIERFNRTVRYDWLGHYLFESLHELQEFATNWQWLYNHERPNMALGGFTPKQHLAKAA